jgi:mediator of RNA polymerase II transcription subunit 7
MAAQQQQQQNANSTDVAEVRSMPIPPMQYVKMFTDEAVKKGTAPKPPPPLHDTYSMFGLTINNDDAIIQSLDSQGIKKLLPSKDLDRKKELRKLNHSILMNFLDMLDMLIKCPESSKREEKLDDINLLFIHMHHLINEYRPHQARETLRVMLMVQKRRRVQFTTKFRDQLEKVKNIIQDALDSLPEPQEAMEVEDSKAETGLSGALKEGDSEAGVVSNLDRFMCDMLDAN